jgi:hypothetical protein
MRSDAINEGINRDKGKFRDERYVRCSHCGFICHLDRDSRAPRGSHAGSGMTYPTTTSVVLDAKTGVVTSRTYTTTNDDMDSKHTGNTTAETRNDAVRAGGCPQCGTYLYAE